MSLRQAAKQVKAEELHEAKLRTKGPNVLYTLLVDLLTA